MSSDEEDLRGDFAVGSALLSAVLAIVLMSQCQHKCCTHRRWSVRSLVRTQTFVDRLARRRKRRRVEAEAAAEAEQHRREAAAAAYAQQHSNLIVVNPQLEGEIDDAVATDPGAASRDGVGSLGGTGPPIAVASPVLATPDASPIQVRVQLAGDPRSAHGVTVRNEGWGVFIVGLEPKGPAEEAIRTAAGGTGGLRIDMINGHPVRTDTPASPVAALLRRQRRITLLLSHDPEAYNNTLARVNRGKLRWASLVSVFSRKRRRGSAAQVIPSPRGGPALSATQPSGAGGKHNVGQDAAGAMKKMAPGSGSNGGQGAASPPPSSTAHVVDVDRGGRRGSVELNDDGVVFEGVGNGPTTEDGTQPSDTGHRQTAERRSQVGSEGASPIEDGVRSEPQQRKDGDTVAQTNRDNPRKSPPALKDNPMISWS
eukprot:CAMPEP_0182925366 /NCGR_PEP_ID=MMETSP0105_2-20130417/9375_1 /TAXON_ID=81532 ORGANISM="Acanthoeca-like sp., Strain 10tr" /NCGR_SAMPLE_ID=MMETSP0105_2 /ASSEMBLY_ACC=CAM_ASM_000205 /LENGTH=425 /DNA_ID=CAMNT_0025063213 /DNA_START=19 /DNA_END=1296 /DNA_ORIENTATION=-